MPVGANVRFACPDHGEVVWRHVLPDELVVTQGLCWWVVTAHDWRVNREDAWLTDMRHPPGSGGAGGIVTESWSGLVLVHTLDPGP